MNFQALWFGISPEPVKQLIDVFAEIHKATAMRQISNTSEVRTRRFETMITGKARHIHWH